MFQSSPRRQAREGARQGRIFMVDVTLLELRKSGFYLETVWIMCFTDIFS